MKNKWIQIVIVSSVLLGAYAFIYSIQKKSRRSYLSSGFSSTKQKISQDYFKGKTIEWLIPFKEGGGADTWARYNTPFFNKYIPGNPLIVVSNIAGGGSITGANAFADKAKPDGLMLIGTSGTTQMPYMLGDPRVRYDYADTRPVMAYPNGGVVYCSPKLGIKNGFEMTQIKDKDLIFASQGPTSLDLVPMYSFDLLGMNVKAVFGFKGRGSGRLAFERGEVLIDYQTSSSYLKNVVPMVERGEAIPLFTFGALDEEGALIRDPSFPDLPHFGEIFEYFGNKREGLDWDTWFAFMSAGYGAMKLLLTKKDTPDEIVALIQKGIIEMKQDEQYKKTKVKALGLYPQLIGKGADKIFKMATQMDDREKNHMKAWLRKTFGLNI